MVNGIGQSFNSSYPSNVTGKTPMTREIASYCYDTQRPEIAKTFGYLTTEDKPSYKWPIIGLIASTVSLMAVRLLKKGKA